MEHVEERAGWSKMVLAERNDGAHEWLQATYLCATRMEATTVESFKMPSQLRRGTKVLVRRELTVYGAQNGQMFVVFNWRVSEPFYRIDRFSDG